MTLGGYSGRYLEVDLTKGSAEFRDTPLDLVEKYLGGKWLAAYYLYKHLNPRVDPLSPENVLLVMPGPVTGTIAPLASKISFFFKSPLSGLFGESTMGGNFPAAFKWAGLDFMVIKGASEEPAYIYVDQQRAEIRDAKHLWGLNTEETEKRLEKELGLDIEVCEIGPAGESLIRYASVSHGYGDRKRESKAGRVGAGAVMGSKKLKAIVVRAKYRKVSVFDEAGLREFVKEVNRKIAEDPALGGPSYRKYGTLATMVPAQKMGFFPVKYWQYGQTEGWDKLNPDVFVGKYFKKNVACWNCPFFCGKFSGVEEGMLKGLTTKGPEYETTYSFGGLCDIADYEKLISINVLCDRYGLDTIETGNIIGLVIYAYKAGLLKLDRPVEFGDYASVLWLFEKIVRREGELGYYMGEGIRKLSEKYGLEGIAVHVKGVSPAGYDPRRLKGMALSYGVSTRGACHLRTRSYAWEIRGIIDSLDTSEEKVDFIVDKEDLISLHDSLILCRFGGFVYTWDRTRELIKHVTGVDRTVEEYKEISKEVHAMIRAFNIKAGMVPKVDDMLPERFFKEPLKTQDGREYRLTLAEYTSMLTAYYRKRGWTEEGYPPHLS